MLSFLGDGGFPVLTNGTGPHPTLMELGGSSGAPLPRAKGCPRTLPGPLTTREEVDLWWCSHHKFREKVDTESEQVALAAPRLSNHYHLSGE
jgi:hypothetical protein